MMYYTFGGALHLNGNEKLLIKLLGQLCTTVSTYQRVQLSSTPQHVPLKRGSGVTEPGGGGGGDPLRR